MKQVQFESMVRWIKSELSQWCGGSMVRAASNLHNKRIRQGPCVNGTNESMEQWRKVSTNR